MRFIDRNDQGDTRIDLTPLVDTVFLLLIFFMLSSAFVITPGIKVELPKAAYERVFREKKEIRVSITRKNRIYVDRKRVNLKELEKIFRERAKKAPQTMVIIRADSRALHGKVVEVMDLAKSAGLSKLAIATRPKKRRK
ncbi:MAG: biopolymer transporter ExbD [Deltaproteobacteria bacterium]|mgnify:FL=1|nr:MAG: biopolymer transporter ExbD [Deltaproteobacteria bacterium]